MFSKAQPVFLKGMSRVMNVTGIFCCRLPARGERAVLRLTGATRYRVWFNGELLAYGPARAAHGRARVDCLPLDLSRGGELRICVASYNVRSFDGVNHPGFLMAEVECGGDILAATGYDFESFMDVSRLRRVMRFSYQRHFSEAYRGFGELEPWPSERVEADLIWMPRETPAPCMELIPLPTLAAVGRCAPGERHHAQGRFITGVPEASDGYPVSELEAAPYDDYLSLRFEGELSPRAFEALELSAGEYALGDFGRVHTGFMRASVEVLERARLLIAYEDYCPDAWVPTDRLAGQYIHVVSFELEPGRYQLETFDPVDLRYMQFTLTEGRARITGAGMRTFTYPHCERERLDSGDALLDEIYGAAVETFRQNALDVYMDCPTRERAGWLCDSYYTAQAEFAFTGDNRLERAFLRNFVQAGSLDGLPRGMLPMCYPSDVLNGEFIPQWAMWYVLELEAALARDPSMDREYFRGTCYGLKDCLSAYLNAEGLLERLPGWNFVEWSRCNDWTQDVSYPTNFLYGRVLRAIGDMYGDDALRAQSAHVLSETARRSFDGSFFTDNAVRGADGALVNTGNTSETCQYYALRFGGVDIGEERYRTLREAFTEVFGPDHARYASLGRDVEPSNAFMGIYLRLECLLELGMNERALAEIKGFFGGMARLTGTLWEHNRVYGGSLNHGFASFVGAALLRALGRT